MNIEIKEFLNGQETPEMIDFYEGVSNALVTLGQVQFAEVADELMMITGTSSIESFVKHYRELLDSTAEIIIEEHGITLNPETALRFKALFLEFFIQIEKTELIEHINNLLQSDEDNNLELFSEVVSVVIGCPQEHIIMALAAVPDTVIRNMRSYISQRCDMEIALESIDTPELRSQYKALESYCRLMKAQETIGYVLAFQPDGRVGGDLESMVQMHFQHFNRTSVNAFAKELMAITLCSDSWNNPVDAIAKVIGKRTENLTEVSNIRAAIEIEINSWQFKANKDTENVKG